MMFKPHACLLILAAALISSNALAQDRGLFGALSGEPESGPSQSAPGQTNAPPSDPAAVPGSEPAPPIVFPALSECRSRLSGLPAGTKDETISLLTKRISFWREQTLPDIVPFRHPKQAEFTLGCFEKRLDLLAAFIPRTLEREQAERTADEIRARWGDRLQRYLSADPPEAATEAWWTEADSAFELLARLDVELGRAARQRPDERRRRMAEARRHMDEFRATIESVRSTQDTFDGANRAFWLRAMAWRARNAGLALDELHRHDFEQDADGAYALLTPQAKAGETPSETVVAGDLAAVLERLRQLRRERGQLDPGVPRDWSNLGRRQAVLEELDLVNYMAQSVEDRINDWQRDRADAFKLKLQLAHDVALMEGIPEAESKAARDREWRAFRDQQRQDKEMALRRWSAVLNSERKAATLHGPRAAASGP